MNKKGLTLIELLGVIIVLGIIAAISFPAINRVINNSRKGAVASDANALVEAAKSFANDKYILGTETADANGVDITAQQLIDAGYLEDNFNYSVAKVTVKVVTDETTDFKQIEISAFAIRNTDWQIVITSSTDKDIPNSFSKDHVDKATTATI